MSFIARFHRGIRAVLGLTLCIGLHAQITGGLRGTVIDASGGAVTSAKISLKSIEQGRFASNQ